MLEGSKGPKITNSHSFNHIKNEEKKPEEEQAMQTTQKRGQPKINANKLPPAFTNKRQTKIVEPLKKPKQAVRNLDNIEAIQEYKQISQMLSPLKRESNQSKNPLAPLRHFMKNQQKIQEELGLSISTLVQGQIRMEDMITTGTLRSYADQSPVKKMLHAPTLKIYVVKEEPLHNKEIRKNIKDWISFWQNKFGNSGLHVQVYSTFWNTPEGYVSLVMEYLNGGSLQSLFESVGFLPERAIKQLIPPILSGLNKIHQQGGLCHGGLLPSQILLTRDGQVKLNLGLQYRVQTQQSQLFNSYLLGKPKDTQSLYDPTILETPSLWSKASSDKIQFPAQDEFTMERANDIWRLGWIMLSCAVGTLDFHPKTQQLYEGLRIILEDIQRYADQLKDTCCILHSEDKIITLVEQNLKQISEPSKITILDMLQPDKFSADFTKFLCATLKIDPRQRISTEQLQQHPFITNLKDYKGPNVSLKELLQISNAWNCYLPEEFQGQGEKKLDRLCDALQLVLSNADKPTITKVQLQENSPLVRELANDMGVSTKIVSERLIAIFQSLI